MSKNEFLTAEMLLEKKNIIEKTRNGDVFESEFLDAKISIKRLPLEEVYEIMQDESKSSFKKQCELVYMSCDCFRDKKLMDEFEVKEPYDIVGAIYSNNAVEFSKLTEKILSLYGFGVETDIKK